MEQILRTLVNQFITGSILLNADSVHDDDDDYDDVDDRVKRRLKNPYNVKSTIPTAFHLSLFILEITL